MDTKNNFRRSRTYIKYAECRHLLRAAVELLGYKLDKSGSSTRDLKYKSEAFDDVIIITGRTNYELFFNPRTSERGDVVQFLQHRAGSTVNQFAELQPNRQFVDQKLREASGYTLRTDYVEPTRTKTVKTPFCPDTEQYVIKSLPETLDQMPNGILALLQKRGIDPQVFWEKDMWNSVGILWLKHNERRIPNLVFLWKDPESWETLGAQYKFYMQGPDGQQSSKKVFVKGSDRSQSLWMTNLEGKTKLFITEDVFDAVAHRLLMKDDTIGYCATGGSITPEQIAQIRSLVKTRQMQLVLGNDNDGAGMLSNLKIITDLKSYEYSKQRQTLQFTMMDDTSYSFDYSRSTEPLVARIRELAEKRNILIEVPRRKDWNEDLKAQPSQTLTTLRKECQQSLQRETHSRVQQKGEKL